MTHFYAATHFLMSGSTASPQSNHRHAGHGKPRKQRSTEEKQKSTGKGGPNEGYRRP